MGYEVEQLAFYEISTNKMIPVDLPGELGKQELIGFIEQFKLKSLLCDLMEPFRCIIDHAALLAFNRKQFSEKDFTLIKQEYHLKYEKCADYYRVFYDELIARKMDIFKFVQQYYRCFMGCKSVKEYPIFEF